MVGFSLIRTRSSFSSISLCFLFTKVSLQLGLSKLWFACFRCNSFLLTLPLSGHRFVSLEHSLLFSTLPLFFLHFHFHLLQRRLWVRSSFCKNHVVRHPSINSIRVCALVSSLEILRLWVGAFTLLLWPQFKFHQKIFISPWKPFTRFAIGKSAERWTLFVGNFSS